MSDIILSNITKMYGDKVVFSCFSLTIEPGEFVCISGESGKGKSTILNIMGLLDFPDTGDVIIRGVKNASLQSASGRKLARKEIAYVFQNYGLVEDQTVIYNMKIAAKFSEKQSIQDYYDALEEVGLKQGVLKQKIYQLSGGEQQRVALARLHVKPSSIILADEPTGSLDATNRDIIMNILKKHNEAGKTLVVVTHDKEIEKCANRVVRL